MNLKVLGFSTVAATALTAVAFTAAPTQAASITVGSTLNIANTGTDNRTGGVFFEPRGRNDQNLRLNFFSAIEGTSTNPVYTGQRVGVGGSTGSFFGATSGPAPQATIKDLRLIPTLTPNIFTIARQIDNFLEGIDIVGVVPDGDDVQFTLTRFLYNAVTGDSTALEGFFTRGTQTIAARGRFTSQPDVTNPSSFSLSITAVPTPALLPGLVGFGVAALRKRKREATAQAEA